MANPRTLRLRERFPNDSEGQVCGYIQGKIVRTSPRFAAELVKYSDSDVVFKDEEGTQADRFMSTRLRDCLKRLAALTAIEWPGVKPRVTEAWDENNEHRQGSLHYEGRSADLTTSDRDGGKYGRLAGLAVEAGFDWVLFENSAHVHVSVKR